jgi:glycosyltransferase involved in cell wall biosynthesis
MKSAAFLVFPSLWYEGCSLVILEAFACGVPVVAFRLGMMAEVIEAGRTGFHARPGDAVSLAEQVESAFRAPGHLAEMARLCRREYEAKYSEERGYAELMRVYELACGRIPVPHPAHITPDTAPDPGGHTQAYIESARIGGGEN